MDFIILTPRVIHVDGVVEGQPPVVREIVDQVLRDLLGWPEKFGRPGMSSNPGKLKVPLGLLPLPNWPKLCPHY